MEFDLAVGPARRAWPGALAALRAAVPAAGAVHVVNNGAAALVLAATALAAGREIIVSRGELVEIGDGFRLPELLAVHRRPDPRGRHHQPDRPARLRRRGRPGHRFILKVHPSQLTGSSGFTAVGHRRGARRLGVPVVVDIGSGLLAPDPAAARRARRRDASLRAGADLVTASGDKLLGGPQAGPGARRAGDWSTGCARHPLARALRVDKLTLAALEATLRGPAAPVAQALHADPYAAAGAGRTPGGAAGRGGVDCRAVPADGAVGGGGAPGVVCPAAAVAVPDLRLARPYCAPGDLRWSAGLSDGRLLLDLRCVPAEDRHGDCRRGDRCAPSAAGRRGIQPGLSACTSSPPPGMSTTGSPPWSAR